MVKTLQKTTAKYNQSINVTRSLSPSYPEQLNSRSTAAPLASAALYFKYDSTKCGNCSIDYVMVSMLLKLVSISWSMV